MAPQIGQYEQLNIDPSATNSQLVDILNNIVTASRSASAGTLGGFSLILIVLLLFKSIEDAFNDIWGPRRPFPHDANRLLLDDPDFLGAVLFSSSVALLGAGAFVNVFMEKLPGGTELLKCSAGRYPSFPSYCWRAF